MPSKPSRYGMAIVVAVLLLGMAPAQSPSQSTPPGSAAPGATMPPQQLDDLVAPIALYPDPLLGQILAASTYPLEIAEAEQWVRDHPKWKPKKLMDEVKKQNWDPSVQGLAAFPDVLARLSQNISWTTQLGNAFLAQQADVMQAVQRMRAQAQAKGTLHSTPQETVTTQNQGGQTAITIQPANPEVWYVPYYNPVYIWGPPAFGYYPPWAYPGIGFGFGYGFGPGIYIGGFFGGLGWGGWGWGPNWFGCSIFQNAFFFNHYGYGFHGGRGFGGRPIWAHDPGHRLGVPYPNRSLSNRYGGVSNAAARGGLSAGRFGAQSNVAQQHNSAPRGNAAQAGGWNHFGQAGSTGRQGAQGSYRSTPAYGGSSAYRASPSYGSSYGANRSTPSYRSSPSYGGSGGYRPSPSYGGSYGGNRTVPSYRSSPSYGGGGGYHSSPSFSGGGSSRSGGSVRSSGGGSVRSSGGGSVRSSGGGSFHSSGGGSVHSSGGGSVHGSGGGRH